MKKIKIADWFTPVRPQMMALVLVLGGALYLSIIQGANTATTAIVVGLVATLRDLAK